MARLLQLAFNVPVLQSFTYQDLPDAETPLGVRVVAPFGRRAVTGFVVGITEVAPAGVELRAVSRRVDAEPLVDAALLELAQWVADTYLCSLGEALAAMVPSGRRETMPDDIDDEVESWREHELTNEQRHAVDALTAPAPPPAAASATADATPGPNARLFYLRGITGSGKTAVFMEAARRTVAAGRGVIYLVPEISLTHQVVDQFTDVFGDQVAVIHSAMTPSQRLQQWGRIRAGAARVVIGARSAVFAPLQRLGLIVLDEEHEGSYKSSATPRYHARQVAMHRSRTEAATLVMGSATPSIEALYHMNGGLVTCLQLTRRPGGGSMPDVQVIDMAGEQAPLSARLLDNMRATAAAGRQSILFLNRRGFSYFFHCRSCGYEMRCANCSVSLTFHKATNLMLCHYCGYQARPMQVCPDCRSLDTGYSGFGTQRIEEELSAALPDLRVRRLDTDATRNRRDLRSVLAQFRDRKIDVLVGTQMVAKGLNFPGVKLVGIVNADTGLHLPDFRAAERTFNLIVQVSGRAGRTLPDGQVFVQTYRPDHDAIRLAVEGRAEEFYQREIELRHQLQFPPFVRLIRVVFRGRDKQRTFQSAQRFAELLESSRPVRAAAGARGGAGTAVGYAPSDHVTGTGSGAALVSVAAGVAGTAVSIPPAANGVLDAPAAPATPFSTADSLHAELLGPAECPIEKIAANYRYHLLVRGRTLGPLHQWVRTAYRAYKPPNGVFLEMDVDPVSVL